jgi:two-component system response regulator HupR/HoxA
MDVLQSYHWPGNVRELENEVRRMIALSDQVVSLEAVSAVIRSGTRFEEDLAVEGDSLFLEDQVRALEVQLIRRALRLEDGNKTRAAERLGISRFTLQRKLEKYADDLGA